LLHYLIEEKHMLTYTKLNRMIKSFAYSPELKSTIPSLVERKHVTEGQLRQSASQSLCLLVVLPIMLCDIVDESDEKFANFILLTQICQMIFAYSISKLSLNLMRHMIFVHHLRFKNLYPEVSITPKFHFLVHTPTIIGYFGPTRNFWCMRYEARHSWFTQAATATRNFKNIAKSVAVKFQLKRAFDLGLGDKDATVLKDRIFCPGNIKIVQKNDVPLGYEISKLLKCGMDEHILSCVDTIDINNFFWEQGRTLLIENEDDDLPVFAKISAIFIKNDECAAVVNLYQTDYFEPKANAYVVSGTKKFLCVLSSSLEICQTFPTCDIGSTKFVTMSYNERVEFVG
jgi:hypothetical protein